MGATVEPVALIQMTKAGDQLELDPTADEGVQFLPRTYKVIP
jgi:hypothetical protein